MAKKRLIYTGFIPQNIAPKNVKNIIVYENGVKKGSIPLGFLERPKGEKLFSIGIISDIHCDGTGATGAGEDFNRALTYFEKQGCVMCCHAGDMTNIGFWNEDGTQNLTQFAEYKKYRDLHPNLPVYGTCGNHESYAKKITETVDKLQEYAGFDMYYSVRHQNDLFIFICQPASYETINKEQLQWLYETLEVNRNIRCHVFVHVFPPNDSGNTLQCYSASFGQYLTQTQALLRHYKNTILYHGHSHIKFKYQELDENTNYTNKNGYHSIHIPSSSHCMDVALQENGSYKRVVDYTVAQGYVVDFYSDYIIYNGVTFETEEPEPFGTFKIDLSPVAIEGNAFVDSTGVITK